MIPVLEFQQINKYTIVRNGSCKAMGGGDNDTQDKDTGMVMEIIFSAEHLVPGG